jgi:hypothetical protein
MTFPEMILFLETHYIGKFAPLMADMIKQLIDSMEVSYKEALQRVLLTHTQKFGLPDLAVFQKALSTTQSARLEVIALQEWDKVCKNVHYYKSITFKDVRTCYAFRAIGGIEGFCNRPEKDQAWIQKEFISAFKSADAVKENLDRIEFHGGMDDSDEKMLYIGFTPEEVLQIQDEKRMKIGHVNKLLERMVANGERY